MKFESPPLVVRKWRCLDVAIDSASCASYNDSDSHVQDVPVSHWHARTSPAYSYVHIDRPLHCTTIHNVAQVFWWTSESSRNIAIRVVHGEREGKSKIKIAGFVTAEEKAVQLCIWTRGKEIRRQSIAATGVEYCRDCRDLVA